MKSPLLRSISRILRMASAGNESDGKTAQGVTRREFLTTAAIGAGAFFTENTFAGLPRWLNSGPPVIIVGAGVAGLTAAYRLAQAGIACEIFEAGPRVGGRMFTHAGFNPDGMFVELGGEFIDSTHDAILKLCKELNVPVDDFTVDDAGLAHELYFSENRLRSDEELAKAFKPLGEALAADIDSLSVDGELMTPNYHETMGAAGKRLDSLSLRAYLDAQRTHVDGWVLDLVERAFVGEYGGDAENQSALNLLVLIEPSVEHGVKFYGASDAAKRVRGGNGLLPEALAKAIRGRVRIHLGSPLVDIRDRSSNLRLTFGRPGGGHRCIDARRVLLTLPFSTLRRVAGVGALALSPQKRRSIFELGYGTNAKLMLGFHDRFWRQATPQIPASTGQMFWDGTSHEVWDTSRLQAGNRGILTSFFGGRAGLQMDSQLVPQTLKDLSRVHGNRVMTRFDGHRALCAWARMPYSRGSYTCPKPGQYTEFLGSEGESEMSNRLFFAGEHCSLVAQGYMNGAVESAETAVASILGKVSAKPRV